LDGKIQNDCTHLCGNYVYHGGDLHHIKRDHAVIQMRAADAQSCSDSNEGR